MGPSGAERRGTPRPRAAPPGNQGPRPPTASTLSSWAGRPLALTHRAVFNHDAPADGSPESAVLALCVGLRADLDRQRALLEELAAAARESRPGVAGRARMFTTAHLAEAWQVSARTIEALVAEDALTPTYVKGARRFSLDAVEAYERKATGRRRRSARRRTRPESSHVGHGAPDRGPLTASRGRDHV